MYRFAPMRKKDIIIHYKYQMDLEILTILYNHLGLRQRMYDISYHAIPKVKPTVHKRIRGRSDHIDFH